LNRDTYTRRCFEIPATRTLMLSEYSDDLAGLFSEGAEAEFFRDRDEMIDKISKYVCDPPTLRSVSEAGYRRVTQDQHDVRARMMRVVELTNDIQAGGCR